MLELLQAIEIT